MDNHERFGDQGRGQTHRVIAILRTRWRLLSVAIITALIILGGLVAFATHHGGRGPEQVSSASNLTPAQAGKRYANGHCTGSEIKKLTHLPIDAGDITTVLPYGGVVGAHIMPISHGYIWPGAPGGPRDQFNVYAMADSTLYGISSRSINVDTNTPKKTEYGLVFSVSCVEFYYYDLMTSLTPELQKYLDEHPSKQSQGDSVTVDIPVKAGQLLGKIGGQTLDYAVWDFNKTLTGYIVPEHYDGDAPRIHLVSPFDYVTDDVKQVLESKLVRSVEPLGGKVDYDIDGKLVGGWFQDGTGSYGGASGQGGSRYWAGHLAVVPDEIDPTLMLISIGTYNPPEEEGQFAVSEDAPDPKTVGPESGLVKYDLFQIDHSRADGSMWDRISPAKGLRGRAHGSSQGCAAFQLASTRKLKAEFFPNHPCSTVTGFDAGAKTYAR